MPGTPYQNQQRQAMAQPGGKPMVKSFMPAQPSSQKMAYDYKSPAAQQNLMGAANYRAPDPQSPQGRLFNRFNPRDLFMSRNRFFNFRNPYGGY